MPTSYYNNQIALQLDFKGFIQKIIVNTYDDISIEEKDSAIHLFSDKSISKYYDHFSQTLNEGISLGFRVVLANEATVFMFIMKGEHDITLFSISLDDEVVGLFDELVKINNEQVRSIRELYKKVSKYKENYGFLEEIMMVNNALINTRRELFHKNNQLQQLNEELELANDTDYLTQMPNRRKFFKDVYKLVQQQSYLFVMMDFNNFKIINDKYGHVRGDELLAFFAREMIDYCEPYNGVMYRLGGDEFACLIPTKNSFDVDQMFATIDEKILKFDSDISMAYGHLVIDKANVNDNHKIEESMIVADRMMYKMKQEFHHLSHPEEEESE